MANLIDDILANRGIGTPGINPGAPSPTTPAPKGPFGGLDRLLTNPGGSFLMNLLAQSGYSTTPQSPLGAIGRAGIATQQQQQEFQQNQIQNELLRQRIGLAGRPQRKVQSAQTLANGNIGYLDAFTGEVVDTGQKAGGRTQVVDIEGRGRFIFDPVQGTLDPIAGEETIQEGLAGRTGAERTAADTAAANVKAQETLPGQIAKDQSFIDRAEQFIGMLEGGDLNTGPIRGKIPALTTNEQLFQAFSGENVIQSISEATFGQLSEGERKFIETTNPNRGLTEEANIDIMKRKIRYIRAAQDRARNRLSRAGDSDEGFEGFSIVE